MELVLISATIVITAAILANTNIKITITHNYPEQPVQSAHSTGTTQEDLDKVYTESNPNNFDDVIKSINAEFGGVDNGEDTTT